MAENSGGSSDGVTERIRRISEMETRLNRAASALEELERALDGYETVQGDLRVLSQYYGSRTWKEDFETDEAGLLPPDLRRGVLSEDGIDSVLERSEELRARINGLQQQGSV